MNITMTEHLLSVFDWENSNIKTVPDITRSHFPMNSCGIRKNNSSPSVTESVYPLILSTAPPGVKYVLPQSKIRFILC